jgi:hypothetical protein
LLARWLVPLLAFSAASGIIFVLELQLGARRSRLCTRWECCEAPASHSDADKPKPKGALVYGTTMDRKQTEHEQCRQATFDRRYKLLELKERRADRALKLRELEMSLGSGIKFTSAQATVAGAVLALVSALIGALIQGLITRDVEAGKNQALIVVEDLKAKASIALEKQKQDASTWLKDGTSTAR